MSVYSFTKTSAAEINASKNSYRYSNWPTALTTTPSPFPRHRHFVQCTAVIINGWHRKSGRTHTHTHTQVPERSATRANYRIQSSITLLIYDRHCLPFFSSSSSFLSANEDVAIYNISAIWPLVHSLYAGTVINDFTTTFYQKINAN